MIRVLFPVFLIALLIAGCIGNASDETLAAAGEAMTSGATPVLTAEAEPAATDTPPPTSSPTPMPPTSTPTLTPTPTPTETSSPTATPTATVPPTDTPTVAPSATPLPTPTSAPPTPAADTTAILREQLAAAILELNNYHWALREDFPDRFGFFKPTAAVNCRSIISAHDRILSLFSLDVSASDPAAQNAQVVALEGVRQFNIVVGDWTESCRQAVAAGSETNILGRTKYEEMTPALRVPDNLWNQALRMLDE